MSELTDFLLAAIAEDERSASACIAAVGGHRAGEQYGDGSGTADRDAFPDYPWGSSKQELDFMAGPGHPARVLAECEAKRRLIDLYLTEPRSTHWSGGRLSALETCVKILVAAYADRPGYLPAWPGYLPEWRL